MSVSDAAITNLLHAVDEILKWTILTRKKYFHVILCMNAVQDGFNFALSLCIKS